MKFLKKFFLLSVISKALAAEFAVVSFNGDCQLNVGGNLVPMTRYNPNVPLYKANVDVPSGIKYNYICGGRIDYDRQLAGDKTYNELFDRGLTIYNMPEFGYPNAEPWVRSIGRTELFDPTYVPIVIIDASAEDIVSLGNGNYMSFKSISFILKENVFTFNNVPASSKNQEENKFQFSINLPDGGIYHRTALKFRPSSTDPAFIRQILYSDIAHAIGNPAHESIAVRVYLSNGAGVGLYVLQEDSTTESFVSTAFYGNPDGSIKNYERNVIYDCSTGADFTFNEENTLGSFINNTFDYKTQLKDMVIKLAQLDIQDEDAVRDFDQNDFHLDTLFRALALEYLAGHWDSYWGLSTNFVLYHPTDDTGRYRFFFIDQDFDQTWSVGMSAYLDPQNYPDRPYTTLVNIPNWKELTENPFDVSTRIIVSKFIGCNGANTCVTKKMFESHLQSIVQHVFNPVAIGRKVEGYKERLMEEIYWDLSFDRIYKAPTPQFHFTVDDFVNNLYTGNYPSSILYYGIMDWTEHITNTVCNQFGIQYDTIPYTPETAANVSVQPIDAGTTYDPSTNLMSGTTTQSKISAITILVTITLGLILIF